MKKLFYIKKTLIINLKILYQHSKCKKLNNGIINYEKSTKNIVKIIFISIFISNYIEITDRLICKLMKILLENFNCKTKK